MNKEHVSSFGLSTMVFALSSAPFYGIFSSYSINSSNTSIIISLPIGFVISLLLTFIILKFFKSHEDLNFTKKLKYIFNKFSIVLIILMVFCSLCEYILLTYRLTTFLSNQYLVLTPKYILSLSIILLTYYMSSKGIETTIRVSIISFFISILIFLFDFFSLLNEVNLNNLLPLFTVSIKDILLSSIIFAFFFSTPVFHINTLSFNQINDKNKFTKYYYFMICLSFIVIYLFTLSTISVSGVNICNLFDYPIYTNLKRIKLFSFLDSVENVSIMLWIFYIINSSSLMILFVLNTLKQSFNLSPKKYKITTIFILLISFIIPNFIFLKNNYNESYDYIYLPLSLLILMILILTISLIKNRFLK